jgi:thioredoxin:protein disulfide reductase
MKMLRYLPLLWCLALPAQADGLLSLFGGDKQSFLSPDAAFGLSVSVLDDHTLLASFKVAPDYYLYRNKINFSASAGATRINSIELPQGELKQDPNLGELRVFHQSFQARISLDRSVSAAQSLKLQASYQGCSEKGLCYPPIDKTFELALPAAALASASTDNHPVEAAKVLIAPVESDSSQIAKLFRQGSFWLIVSFFFGAGLLLAFTPCMFPMVPILSGIIVGRGDKITHMHGFILSLAYVLGMALTYAAVGVAAGFSGTLLSNALQTPWALGGFAAIFVLLSLAMFGFYELQLPTALQNRLTGTSNKLHGGHLSGVFVMGALSAIIVGPCVAAPLAGALLYIGQTHDAFLGGAALFSLALGMGLPLLLIGASAGALLPRAGAWMESVKRFFGVLLLAVAIWVISPLIPLGIEMLLWAVLLVLSAIFLHALDALPHGANHWHKLWKGIGILALLLGIAYLIGALSGASDILRPLGAMSSAQAKTPATIQFTRIKSLSDLQTRINQAHGKTILLDFYADWCTSCKEMERYTFSDAAIQARLKNMLLLRADVTANDESDRALLQHFDLFGPPAILFFDPQSRELSDYRVTGYQDAPQFLLSLQAAGM